jgi:tetratricopeptide (TPR) repeat protein
LKEGQPGKAIETLEEGLRFKVKDDTPVRNLLAQAKVAEERRLAEEAARQQQLQFDGLVREARQQLKEGQPSKTIETLEGALRLKVKEDAPARELLGQAKVAEERRLAEEVALRRQLQFDSLLSKAQQQLREEQTDKAIENLEKALALKVKEDAPARELLVRAKAAQANLLQLAYDKAMAAGREARKGGNFSAAIAAFQEALRQQPDDPEAKTALEEADFAAALAKGSDALEAKRFAEAVPLLQKALQRRPADTECQGLLAQARTRWRRQLMKDGRTHLAAERYEEAVKAFTAARDLAADETVASLLADAQFHIYLQRGRRQIDEKDYSAAVASLTEATRLNMKDPDAGSLLQQAEKLLAAQIEAEYQAAMADGEAAMKGNDYLRAMRAYKTALSKKAKDPQATDKLTKAQAAQDKAEYDQVLAEGDAAMLIKDYPRAIALFKKALDRKPKNARAADSLAQAEKAQNTLEYDRAISDGDAALARKDYAKAIDAYSRALQKRMNDSAATAKLQKAKDDKLKKESYDQHVSRGKAHLTAKNYDLAELAFQAALRDVPNEPDATRLLKEAQTLKTKKESYGRHITVGNLAMLRKDYGAAETEFQGALTDIPNDLDATRLLKEAQTLKAKKESYGRHMAAGNLAMLRRDYRTAETEFQAALTDIPGDPDATRRLQEARMLKAKKESYDRHMSAGNGFLASKNFRSAETEFQAALVDMPGDPEAMRQLQKAKQGKP